MKKIVVMVALFAVLAIIVGLFSGCKMDGSEVDIEKTEKNAAKLQSNQPTPTDISYSLERYNLIRRAYWVNGQREKANMLPCEVQKPLGYIVLFSGNTVVGSFVVDGKVSSLNSFLTPDTEYPSYDSSSNEWLADVDGSYGENDAGIFFFDVRGNYIEWTGTYLYTDIPMEIDDPVVKFDVAYD